MNRTRNSLKGAHHEQETTGETGSTQRQADRSNFFFNASLILLLYLAFPDGAMVKNPPANAGDARDTGLIPESGKSPRVGNSNLLQYSGLGNPMARGAWQATVHGVAMSWI